MPISRPWNAYEHTRIKQQWNLEDAKKLDAFSLGMLCLWVLFRERLSEMMWHHGSKRSVEGIASSSDAKDHALDILLKSKNEKRLSSLARKLLDAERNLDSHKKTALQEFFISTLSDNQSERDIMCGGLFSSGTLFRPRDEAERIDDTQEDEILGAEEEDMRRIYGFETPDQTTDEEILSSTPDEDDFLLEDLGYSAQDDAFAVGLEEVPTTVAPDVAIKVIR
jgi:hypothetical protein